MKSSINCSIKKWLLAGVLLAITLWFPSTREAQTLCLRWLLSLKGNTLVQGQPDGCVICVIPNVQLTPRYLEEVQSHSTNSLDDYALAIITGNLSKLQTPAVQSSWKKSPLLSWMVLETTWLSVRAANTNVISQKSYGWQQRLIHLAQQTNPTNGAFWQAEAAIDSAAHDNDAAIRALEAAVNRTNWDDGSTGAFTRLSQLLEQAGLSELDAAEVACDREASAGWVQGQNKEFIENQMVQVVREDQPEQFLKLLRLQLEIRRKDWSDHSAEVYNSYRTFFPYDELIDAMARSLKINLATNWSTNYPEAKLISEQVFQKYLSQNADPATVARFNSQTESYQLEHRLRFQIFDRESNSTMRWFGGCQVTAILSLLMLSLSGVALLFEIIIWNLERRTDSVRRWPQEPKFWLLALLIITASSLIFTQAEQASGICNPVGFGPEEPPPLINPLLAGFLLAFLVFSFWLLGLVAEWKSGKQAVKPWVVTRFCICLYLFYIILMAFFRNQYVAEICSRY